MEILEAFDLTGSLRAAAELAGCDHKTVGHWVRAREQAGGVLALGARSRLVTGVFSGKVEELVERSRGKIRADRVHEKLVAIGYQGSERTTRRAVAVAKRRWRQEHGRRTRPWIAEPGLWLQWDYGEGPRVGGRRTVLFCAWLAWSRFRVVLALWDKTMPSVVMALDRALRAFGGSPSYALTDNERMVSVDQVCGIAVRNPQIVSVARHYGLTIATCVPADPQSQGRLGGHGQDRHRRSGPDRSQPAERIRGLRRAGGGVRDVLRPGQRPRASHHPPTARRDAGKGTGATAPAAPGAAHRVLRAAAQGQLAVTDLGGWRAVLGPLPRSRT